MEAVICRETWEPARGKIVHFGPMRPSGRSPKSESGNHLRQVPTGFRVSGDTQVKLEGSKEATYYSFSTGPEVGYTGSPWDYKNYNGETHPEFDAFGNFNYGATGAALGIPHNLLLRGAGAAKWLKLHPDPFGKPLGGEPYGNQPEKQGMINLGIQYFKNHCF